MSPKSSAMEAAGSKLAEVPPDGSKVPLGLENQPKGIPTSYGPVGHRERELAVNPFWPRELPDLGTQDVPAVVRPALGREDGTAELPNMQQLLALILKQNGQLKKELGELRAEMEAERMKAAQAETGKGQGQQVSQKTEDGQPSAKQSLLPLKDAKTDGVEVGISAEWGTPPESVTASKPPALSTEEINIKCLDR